MKILVTGAGGFIGSSMVDRLLTEGHTVIGVDDFSTGQKGFLNDALKNKRFTLVEKDLLSPKALDRVLDSETDWVFHFAANADVREGLTHPDRDLQQNTLVTFYLLEAMRKKNVRRLVFSSTGSIYGESKTIPTPEECPFPVQTSLYGASKLAAEGLISAYVEGYQFKALIFRFVSILGERYTHGHVFDFMKKMRENPKELLILGNGKQRKSYLYIQDCLEAILKALKHPWSHPVEMINLGTDEYVMVDQSVDVICQTLGVEPKRRYSGGDRGWIGDNPFIYLDCAKIRSIGWKPALPIREAVKRTVLYLQAHPELLTSRD
jgi:UDP-glucose 4-epimerase